MGSTIKPPIILSFTISLLTYALFLHPSFSYPLNTEFIYPNFTASRFHITGDAGAFLSSLNGTFKATILNPVKQQNTYFYFSILHVPSNQIIWSANRNAPISDSAKLTLTIKGITISDDNGNLIWTTPSLNSTVRALQLKETGNLVLLDQSNVSLWESFDHPTDTIVIGQRFPIGASLSSAVSETNLSTGAYQFSITDTDAILQWNGLTYWKLSMEALAYRNTNYPVGYMEMNSTGLYLFAGGNGVVGLVVVFQVILDPSDFQIAKLDSGGRFRISSSDKLFQKISWPNDDCQIPNFCDTIGLCFHNESVSSTCSCPSGFRNDPNSKGCLPPNSNYLPSACNSTNNGNQPNLSEISFMVLAPGIDYFANDFSTPDTYSDTFSACENRCFKNCSCLGFFYDNSSASCFLIKNQLGSVRFNTGIPNDRVGYIKTSISPNDNTIDGKQARNFPLAALILLPTIGFFLLLVLSIIGFIWWRRRRLEKMIIVKLGRDGSNSSRELDMISIPGLPVRFHYEELKEVTNNFETQIGSGGFGIVYKGTLPDETFVAVKKITNLGVHGKKEFLTEIVIIANKHHTNLVKLRGFCVHGRHRFLVYEYMNRGSLDRTLFDAGPVIEWQKRVDIGLGTARGLAYLHSGCDQKIIHCDVKPENILLHDHFQVKISDFGLSKLLSPEQSNHFTALRGTRGYLAPEWIATSSVSEKTDVYSYGMVLLEIVSGRRNCLMNSYFPRFALDMHQQRRYLELLDPRLEGRVTSEEVEKLVRVALCCVHDVPMLRPSMASVVGMLEGGIPLGEPRVDALNFLRFNGRNTIEDSVIEGSNVGNGFMLHPQENASPTTSAIYVSLNNISSQQISGPR